MDYPFLPYAGSFEECNAELLDEAMLVYLCTGSLLSPLGRQLFAA